jgi:hypothetical protein
MDLHHSGKGGSPFLYLPRAKAAANFNYDNLGGMPIAIVSGHPTLHTIYV